MFSYIRGVYQTVRRWLLCSTIEFSDTTGERKAPQNGRSYNFFYRKFSPMMSACSTQFSTARDAYVNRKDSIVRVQRQNLVGPRIDRSSDCIRGDLVLRKELRPALCGVSGGYRVSLCGEYLVTPAWADVA